MPKILSTWFVHSPKSLFCALLFKTRLYLRRASNKGFTILVPLECLRWYSYSNCNDYYLTSQSSIEPSVELYKYLNVIVHSIFHRFNRYTWEEEGYFCKWVIKKHKLAFLTSLICMCNMNFDFLKNNIAMELNGSSDHVKLWIKVRPWEFFAASSRPDMDLLKSFWYKKIPQTNIIHFR